MIKKILLAILIAAPMCISAQTLKFGTVNTQEIFNVMPEKATAENTLKDVATKYQNEAKNLETSLQKLYTDFQALEESTPKAIKDRRMQELQEAQQKYQNFQQTANQDMQRQQETLLAPIQEKLQKAIQAVGAEGGFTFIFDLSIPSVIYNGGASQDVTPLVKAKLGIK